jgi:peptide/nickel transport system permease protein
MGKIPKDTSFVGLLIFFLTIWAAATIIWVIPRLAPTDPIAAMVAGMSSAGGFVEDSEAIIAGWRERFGLDDPLWIQYLKYLGNLATRLWLLCGKLSDPSEQHHCCAALPWTMGLLLWADDLDLLDR